MPRTLLLSALAAAVIALDWLRLEEPRRGPVLLVLALAVLPALAARRWRPVALLGAAVLVGELALGLRHLPFRFASGFLDFYDYALPFASVEHHRMAGVVLIAVFGFAASCAQLLAARRPLGAAAVLVAGAGWPVTLLAGGDELLRGAVILAVALVLLAGRLSLRAVPVAAGVVLLAVAASAAPAVAKDAFLPWRTWDPYTRPQQPVGVSYVWDADYRGVRFPRKATTVLEIEAPQTAVYWRATTLDTFGRDHWIQTALPWTPLTGSVDFSGGSLVPARARRARLTRVHVTVRALRDSHLVGGNVPLAFASESAGGIQYAGDGKAVLTAVLIAGDSYTAVSDIERPEPQALARVGARYPVELVNAGFLRIAGYDVPAFGKRRSVTEIRRGLGPYAPLQARATEVARGAATPYAAALAIEEWLRSSGGFRYDEQPPQARGVPPLVGFVERTRAGYCQHFAGAMALMLRTLGIPARIAAGFTSGRYDRPAGRWIVTDRNAHAWVEVWFPGYGWLPFDPTPGRGHLDAPYSAASLSGDPVGVARLLRLARGGSSTQFENKLEGDFAERNGTGTPSGADLPGNGAFGKTRHGLGGSLFVLLAAIAAGLVALVALAKLVRRQARYLTRDPRRLAAACRRELVDVLADQGVELPASATLPEIEDALRAEIGVDASGFVRLATAARFGARPDAAPLRRELRDLRRRIRASLGAGRRARGLVSLRSLGLGA